MNVIIALVGIVGIVAARKLSRQTEKVKLKNHFVILGIKVIFISVIISLFCLNMGKSNYTFLILTGFFNLVVFHFIEAFVIQKKLINNKELNV